MLSDARMQCRICPRKELCPAETRVYVNYCGSMHDELKERIRQARIDCRILRNCLHDHDAALAPELALAHQAQEAILNLA
jgi:hypothetical protein